jgi:hypothetical protein
MTSSEHKLKLFEKELARLERLKAKKQAVIDSQSPTSRYFEITKAITDENGKVKLDTPGFDDLLSEAVEIEQNLVKLGDQHWKKVNKAWDSLPELDMQIGDLTNEIFMLKMRMGK